MDKVSFILTTYNCKDHIAQTLDSILKQDYEEIEAVVVDGGSVDGTVDIIRRYEEHFGGRLKWVSEKDNGIYSAMNKGFHMSSGEILCFFNDVLCKRTAVSKMVKAIKDNNADGAHADLVYLSSRQRVIRYWKMGQGKISQGWMPGHPTLYLRRNVYEKYGLYQETYKCSADYEFMVRILKDGKVKLAYVPEILAYMFYGGTSTEGVNGYILSMKEAHRALRENRIRRAFIVDFRRIMRFMKQFVITQKVQRVFRLNNLGI